MGRKIISYSLYGSRPKYCRGMVRNVYNARYTYPGWEVVVNVDRTVPAATIQAIKDAGAVVVERKSIRVRTLYRVVAALEWSVEVCLFRDADSVLTHRERTAVEAWLGSPEKIHVMYDHPFHRTLIMGGLLSVKLDAVIRESLFKVIRKQHGEFKQSGKPKPVPKTEEPTQSGDQPRLNKALRPLSGPGKMIRHCDKKAVAVPNSIQLPPRPGLQMLGDAVEYPDSNMWKGYREKLANKIGYVAREEPPVYVDLRAREDDPGSVFSAECLLAARRPHPVGVVAGNLNPDDYTRLREAGVDVIGSVKNVYVVTVEQAWDCVARGVQL